MSLFLIAYYFKAISTLLDLINSFISSPEKGKELLASISYPVS